MTSARRPLRLTKHHGLGNDFLVLLDQLEEVDEPAALARELCDRRFGVGADGLLLGRRGDGGHDVAMRLHNADGSVGQMSGNGIRCLVQAAVRAGWAGYGAVRVATDAGPRTVEIRPAEQPGLDLASVAMGPARLVELDPPWAAPWAPRSAVVDVGNPHLVLLADPNAADLQDLHGRAATHFADGVNIEVAQSTAPGQAQMRVWERGVGETLACGTGACAVARALLAFGSGGPSIDVAQPGGVASVRLDGDDATLTGPTRLVAAVEVPA